MYMPLCFFTGRFDSVELEILDARKLYEFVTNLLCDAGHEDLLLTAGPT